MSDPAVVTRREFLSVGAAAIAAADLCGDRAAMRTESQGGTVANASLAGVKALVFDTFGTVVDWRSSIAKEIEDLATRKGFSVDGGKFADAWRGGYGPSMNRVRNGELPWTVLDDLHRMILDRILVEFKITGLSGAEIDALYGAANTLRKYRPTLMLSVYHRPADLWRIPEVVDEIAPGYQFYFRQHDGGTIESVLYAVPA